MTLPLPPSLAPSSHCGARVSAMAHRFLIAILVVALGACGPRPAVPDGGRRDSSVVARARVRVPHESIEASDVELTSFRVAVSSVRLVSDRGASFDPVREDTGLIDLLDGTSLEFDAIPPASYSAAVLVLEGAATTLEIRADDAVLGPMHVSYRSRIEWMARCSSAVPVDVGETLEIAFDVELSDAWEALRAAALPAPTAGIIEIDEESAPEALDELIRALLDGSRAECDGGDSS